jgi:hypothetical protein
MGTCIGGEFLESDTDACNDMAFRIDGEFGESPACGVDDGTRDASIADNKIRSPAYDSD